MEAYRHLLHRQIAQAHGLDPVPLPVDASGAEPERLGTSRRKGRGGVGAVLLTPAHQFPLGVTLAPERRRAFAEWAIGGGGLVIEDDYDREFRYDRQPVGAMQALAPEHVVYAGTASKSLAPGLQLGWLVLPARLLDDVVAAKESCGSFISALDQLTLAEFIVSGGYDRQIRHARLSYRRRRDRLAEMLGQQVPAVSVTGISAGLHALVRLSDRHDEDDVVARAARHGLALSGLASYRAEMRGGSAAAAARGGPRAAVVVGYGRPPGHAFTTALARLCAVLAATGSAR